MRPCLTIVAVAALSIAAPAAAQHAEAPAEATATHAGAESAAAAHHEADRSALSCEQILSEQEEVEENPEVSKYIFHHVSDSYVLAFENPLARGEIAVDFKKLECRLLGTNGVLHLGGFAMDLTPSKHAFWMWVAAFLLIVVLWRSGPKKGQLVPRGVGSLVELLVVFVRDEIARKNFPSQEEADRYTPYLLNCFFFILAMNCLGLIPFCAAATSNLAVTAGLAFLTFVITQVAGVRSAGLSGYLKHLTGGVHWALWPIIIPVEFMGLFTKPIALTIRLFANMVAGHIVIFFLIALIFILKTAWLALMSVPFAFGMYLLELFVALLQAYVFTILSSLFIGMAVATGHHHDAGHAAAEAGGHHDGHAHVSAPLAEEQDHHLIRS
jgi:F-type H+-transporting ATPase subunit a